MLWINIIYAIKDHLRTCLSVCPLSHHWKVLESHLHHVGHHYSDAPLVLLFSVPSAGCEITLVSIYHLYYGPKIGTTVGFIEQC